MKELIIRTNKKIENKQKWTEYFLEINDLYAYRLTLESISQLEWVLKQL